jgi:diadenosine tetraphosphate (Ap4A) HIT family hydrolase
MFKLDSRLQNDTFEVCEYLDCKVLVMNNSILPWIVIVPFTERTEWYQLDDSVQYNINTIINKLSKMLVSDYNVDKLNIATLGNVVEQMHIHVVGRYTTDSAWPNPVWGNIESEEYGYDQRSQIVDEITGALGI